jgi:hypothetical protein
VEEVARAPAGRKARIAELRAELVALRRGDSSQDRDALRKV